MTPQRMARWYRQADPGVSPDGEMMDPSREASLERHMTMQGSFRKPELQRSTGRNADH